MFYLIVIGATGNIGGSLSHEFQLLSSIGEDTIKVCQRWDTSIKSVRFKTEGAG